MLDHAQPPFDAQWRHVAEQLVPHPKLVLAVSGGPDSMAMLVGLARMQQAGDLGADLVCVTIDHRLRAQSADEAGYVADVCAQLGVPHETVSLDPKPQTGNMHEWAREQRYRAFAALGGVALTAHTADDQAETLLMRASRGSGVDGLTGVRAQARLWGCTVLRPFLQWRRKQLHTVLQGSEIKPFDDPSNTNPRYTRVRVRDWLAEAPAMDGDQSLVTGLAMSAHIAAGEAQALDFYAQGLACQLGVGAAGVAQRGFAEGRFQRDAVPAAVLARALRMVLLAVARHEDAQRRLDMAAMTQLANEMLAATILNKERQKQTWVGAGAMLVWRAEGGDIRLHAFAEAGRAGFPTLTLPSGQSALWDKRFVVTNHSDCVLQVRGACGSDCETFAHLPANLLASLPVAVKPGDGELVGSLVACARLDAVVHFEPVCPRA